MKKFYLLFIALMGTLSMNAQNGRLPAEVVPGSKGALPEVAAIAPAREGELTILNLSDVGFDPFIVNGYTHNEANLSFPMVSEVGCEYYTVQYRNHGEGTWSTLKSGDDDWQLSERTVGVSPSIYGTTDYRLVLHGGEHDGYVSNIVTATAPIMYSRYKGWSESPTIDHCMLGRQIGEELSFSAETYKDGNTTQYTHEDGYFTYQWYRRNPNNYDMEKIAGATSITYTPTMEDVGYQLVIEVGGDKQHCDFTLRHPLYGVVCIPVQASIDYIGNDGFILNTDYVISDPQNMFVLGESWMEEPPTLDPSCISEVKPGQYMFRMSEEAFNYSVYELANPAYFLTFHYEMMGWYREVQIMGDRYKLPLGVKVEMNGNPVSTIVDAIAQNIDGEWVVVASKSTDDAVDGVLYFEEEYMPLLYERPHYLKARATDATAETFYPSALSMKNAQTVVPNYGNVVTIEAKDIVTSVAQLAAQPSATQRFFSADGRQGRSRGLNLVRMSDGTVKKVITK